MFQGRFKGILVERDAYLLELSRYVILNPIRAGMTKNISDWPWSSYATTTHEVAPPAWLQVDWVLGQFSKQRKRAIEKYVNFVREGVGLPAIWHQVQNQVFLASEKKNRGQRTIVPNISGF